MPELQNAELSLKEELSQIEKKEYIENIKFTTRASIWYLKKEFISTFAELYRMITRKRNYINAGKLIFKNNNLFFASIMVLIFLLIKNPKLNYIFLNLVVIIFIFASKLTSGRFKGEYREEIKRRAMEKYKSES